MGYVTLEYGVKEWKDRAVYHRRGKFSLSFHFLLTFKWVFEEESFASTPAKIIFVTFLWIHSEGPFKCQKLTFVMIMQVLGSLENVRKYVYRKIQQTKMLGFCQRFGDLFLFIFYLGWSGSTLLITKLIIKVSSK